MIRNEDVEITESTDQKWTCPGQRGKSQDNRKPQRGHPAGPQEGSAGGCRADVWSRPETAGAPTLGAPGKAATGEGRGGRQPPEKFHASRFPAGWAHLSPALWEPIPQPHRDLSDFSQTSRSSPAPRCMESRLCSTSFLIISCPVVFEGLVHCLFFSCKNTHLQGANAGGSGWSNLTALLLHATPAPALPVSEMGVPKPWWPRAHLE